MSLHKNLKDIKMSLTLSKQSFKQFKSYNNSPANKNPKLRSQHNQSASLDSKEYFTTSYELKRKPDSFKIRKCNATDIIDNAAKFRSLYKKNKGAPQKISNVFLNKSSLNYKQNYNMIPLHNDKTQNISLMLAFNEKIRGNSEQSNSRKKIEKKNERGIGMYGVCNETFASQLPDGRHKGFAARRWIENNQSKSQSNFYSEPERNLSSKIVFRVNNTDKAVPVCEKTPTVVKNDGNKVKIYDPIEAFPKAPIQMSQSNQDVIINVEDSNVTSNKDDQFIEISLNNSKEFRKSPNTSTYRQKYKKSIGSLKKIAIPDNKSEQSNLQWPKLQISETGSHKKKEIPKDLNKMELEFSSTRLCINTITEKHVRTINETLNDETSPFRKSFQTFMQTGIKKRGAQSTYKDVSQQFLLRKYSNNTLKYKTDIGKIKSEKSVTTPVEVESPILRECADPALTINATEFTATKKDAQNLIRKFTLNDFYNNNQNENKETFQARIINKSNEKNDSQNAFKKSKSQQLDQSFFMKKQMTSLSKPSINSKSPEPKLKASKSFFIKSHEKNFPIKPTEDISLSDLSFKLQDMGGFNSYIQKILIEMQNRAINADYKTKAMLNNSVSNINNAVKVFSNVYCQFSEPDAKEKIFNTLAEEVPIITDEDKRYYDKLTKILLKCEKLKKTVILYINKYKKDATEEFGE